MWTPRRIFLLSACCVVFIGVYLGYACTAVGSIDGLPPLPEAYWPDPGTGPLVSTDPKRRSKLAEKLKLAFGADCKEQKWAIRLDMQSRNMVLAAQQFAVQDGRVCLQPISIALFGKEKGDGLPAEISIIHGEVAYLTFDRAVHNFSEIGSRKVVEAELSGRIQVINNRRRPANQRDQDLRVHIPIGPLYYRESTRRIWTHDHVTVTDHKSKPHPHVVKGKGMVMELLTEAPPARPGQRRPQRETIAGVKWIELQSTVVMDLYVDGKNNLFGAPQKPAVANGTATAKAPPAERAHLHITTPGRFRYELNKDHDIARFDIPQASPDRPISHPAHVEVIRSNDKEETLDQLVCHHLTLRLRRRDSQQGGKKSADNGSPESLDIETVHATGAGKSVVITSNVEKLNAHADVLFHDAIRKHTVLQAKDVVDIVKEDSKLHAVEVRIQDITPPPVPGQPVGKSYQQVEARGPGHIHLVDRKEKKTLHAHWQTLLTSTRDKGEDLLTLTGKAQFIDEQTKQSLKGDTLKVWLEEVDRKKAQASDGTTSSRRPRHVEAIGNVVARSAEFNIHDTSHLKVWFKDVPATNQLPPVVDRRPTATPVPAGPVVPPPAPVPPRSMPRGPEAPDPRLARPTSHPGPVLASPDKTTPARPFDLSARSVEATVLRSPIKSTIDQLNCDGSVHVRQDPARAEEKGTEIHGDTLKATAGADGGYFLVVTGDLAQLQTDRIYIIGPEVNIDQSTNRAWVHGDGAMKMDSDTNFQGEKLAKPVPLTVHWSKNMLFNGTSAEFQGNIQAVQEKARMACQHLQVYFDRPISLKQGNKSAEPAKVRHLVSDKDVRIEDHVYQGDRLVKYQQLQGTTVEMRSLEPEDDTPRPATGVKESPGNLVITYGPGDVRILDHSEDPAGTPGRATVAKPAGPTVTRPGSEMKMTYVAFQNRMDANSKKNTAYFWGNVRVLNFPCPRHDVVIDLDVFLAGDLPEKAVYMRCDRLKVLDAKPGGKPNKEMWAYGKVYVQGREFDARADEVTYNQAKEQVIFHGKESGPATLRKIPGRGGEPTVIEARKIIYNRATGKVDVDKASSASGSN